MKKALLILASLLMAGAAVAQPVISGVPPFGSITMTNLSAGCVPFGSGTTALTCDPTSPALWNSTTKTLTAPNLIVTNPLGVVSGGTGLASLTAGRIPFGVGTSAFGNDAGLTWDDSTKLFHVGNANGYLTFEDYGTSGYYKIGGDSHLVFANDTNSGRQYIFNGGSVDMSGTSYQYMSMQVWPGAATLSKAVSTIQLEIADPTVTFSVKAAPAQSAHIQDWENNAGTVLAGIDSAGKFGIGTTTPAAKLAVNGGVHVGGDSDPGDNNLMVDGYVAAAAGAAVASATTITPTGMIFHVTGTTAIATINLPFTGFTGTITIIPDGAFTTTTAGNIALASTAVVSKALTMTYDGTKWYPSY